MNAALVRCQQCGESKLPAHFVGKRKAQVTWCTECRGKYKGTYGERASEPRRRLRLYAPEPNVIWSASSGNKKLGGIGSAIISGETCPPSCGFYGRGCYAEFGASGHHWRRSQDEGLAWSAFLDRVREQPPGSLWRYAVAGDLPGVGEALDVTLFDRLVEANRGRRGFAISHKRLVGAGEAEAVARANREGFTVNLSADNLEQADQRAQLGVAPVVVVLPKDAPKQLRTPAGRPIAVCPAQTSDATCASCQLCQRSARTGIVGFRSHGQMHRTVSKIARGETSP